MKISRKLIVVSSLAIITLFSISQVARKTISPSKTNSEPGNKFVTPKVDAPVMQKELPLKVDKFEIQRLSKSSSMGAGQLLLTISGTGFYITSEAPEVIFTKDLKITNVETNKGATELYAIVSERVLKRILESDFSEATVLGRVLPATKGADTFNITPADFKNFQEFEEVTLQAKVGFFTRER